ncbi:hypothetical protein [Bacteroides sp. KG122]|uniref:hypothetical protein n=1 Tax=Bacteroides sp. KG122 TaxID=3397827 RepID=UPI003D997437
MTQRKPISHTRRRGGARLPAAPPARGRGIRPGYNRTLPRPPPEEKDLFPRGKETDGNRTL